MKVLTVPCLQDNYSYLVVDEATKDALVVDPGEAAPLLETLNEHRLRLRAVLNTHHHHDHVGGNEALLKRFDAQLMCSEYDANRIPGADLVGTRFRALRDREEVRLGNLSFEILKIPGHTQGQIAFYFPREEWLFAGDTLFAMGCGRLFEGTPEQMFESFAKIKSLPDSTRLFFGHEYAKRNGEFTIEQAPEMKPQVDRRLHQVEAEVASHGFSSAPTLSDEKKINLFMRAPDVASFAKLREARNTF